MPARHALAAVAVCAGAAAADHGGPGKAALLPISATGTTRSQPIRRTPSGTSTRG